MVGYSLPADCCVAYSIALTCLSATQAIVQLINSSETADTLLSKRPGVGFKPVTS